MSKDKFMKAYANLPSPEREQVIALIDGKPFSWDAAYNEISNDTSLGKRLLDKMVELEIL